MGSGWPDGPGPLACNGPRRPQAGAGRPLQEGYSSRSRWPGAARPSRMHRPTGDATSLRDQSRRTARQPQPTRPGSRRGRRRASLGQPGALRTGGCVRPPGHRRADGHEATSRGGQQRGDAMAAHYRHTTPEMAARIATAIQQRLTVVLRVAPRLLRAVARAACVHRGQLLGPRRLDRTRPLDSGALWVGRRRAVR
jgi:hypothetical protein